MTSKSVRICRSESHLGGIIRFLKKKIASKKEIFLSTKNENHSSTVGVHLLNKLLTHNNKPTTTYWIFHHNAQQLLISISYHRRVQMRSLFESNYFFTSVLPSWADFVDVGEIPLIFVLKAKHSSFVNDKIKWVLWPNIKLSYVGRLVHWTRFNLYYLKLENTI